MADRWSTQKETIRNLFLVKGMALKDVVDEMKKIGFHASKAQYERQLKAWGFHKNKKGSEWKCIGYKVKKRKQSGKDSSVFRDGQLIPGKRVSKEISRHFFPSIHEQYGQAPSPQTPEGVSIRTPPQDASQACQFQKLPLFHFLSSSRVQDICKPDQASVAFMPRELSASHAASTSPQLLHTDAFSTIKSILTQQECQSGQNMQCFLQMVLPKLPYTEELLNSCDTDIDSPFFRVTAYLLSNNQISQNSKARMFEFLRQGGNLHFLRLFLCLKGPVVEALSKTLFRETISANKYSIIEVILSPRFTANRAWMPRGSSHLPHLAFVARDQNLEPTQLLPNYHADVNAAIEGEWIALHVAVERGNMDILQLLLKYNAKINAVASRSIARTSLQAAAGSGNVELVQLLLNYGADVNAAGSTYHGRTALQAAAENGSVEVVQLLLNYGANVNAAGSKYFGLTALQAAAGRDNIRLVQILLNHGADINDYKKDEEGGTALQIAAKNGNTKLVLLLLKNKADINAAPTNYRGRTALQGAVETKDIELVRLLVHNGAHVNAPPCPDGGATAIQVAAMNGSMEILYLLLNHGGDINAPSATKNGRTALEGAAEHGRLGTVQLLLDAGIDICGRDDPQYKSAVQLAYKEGHSAVAKLIESWISNAE